MKKAWGYFWGFIEKLTRGKADVYAASAAFFTIMSVIPFLMLLLSAVRFLPLDENFFIDLINTYAPANLGDMLKNIVVDVYRDSHVAFTFSLITALWLSAKGTQYLCAGLNAMYEIEETRSFFVLRFQAIIHTVLMVIALVVLLALTVFGSNLQELIRQYVPVVATIWDYLMFKRAVITGVVVTLLVDVVYTVMPNRKATLLGQLPGALFCCMGWGLLSIALNIYVERFNGFSMYGSLTTLILLMMWLYFLIYIMLMGGAINFYFNALFRRLRIRLRQWRRRRREARKGIRHDQQE